MFYFYNKVSKLFNSNIIYEQNIKKLLEIKIFYFVHKKQKMNFKVDIKLYFTQQIPILF